MLTEEKHDLSDSVRVIIRPIGNERYARLQEKQAQGWKTISGRNFATDIRVNAVDAMRRVAQQLNLIPAAV